MGKPDRRRMCVRSDELETAKRVIKRKARKMTFSRIIGLMNFISMIVMLGVGNYGIALFNLSIVVISAVEEFIEKGK